MMFIFGILILVFLIFFMINVFNNFVKNKNQVKDAWSNIDVALKRRHDLIPNLVNIVKGYAQYEQETFKQVVEARNAAMDAVKTEINKQIQAEHVLEQSLRKLFALSEAYPDLKANTSFLDLQQKMTEIEENLERSRRYYNGTVRENNNYGESFPALLFAKTFNYQSFEFFEATAFEKENVKVEFGK